nr:reverse transcriptase domain-containing protein [Tanacetum cinerariifolium]
MHDKFQMSDMGELTFFLGLQVLQKKDGIFLSQDKYVGDILKKFRYSDVWSANTPMDKENLWAKDGPDKYVGDILKKFGYSDVRSANIPIDKENPWGKDGTSKDVDLHLYRSMIGSFDVSHCSSTLSTVANESASPVRDVSEREACPTESGFIADQDRATIAKSSTLPHDSAPRAQEVEILRLKERVQVLEDREDVAAKQSGDDAPNKGRSINEGEAAAERITDHLSRLENPELEKLTKAEIRDMFPEEKLITPECMWISGFIHGVNNPELTKHLNEHVPKTMERMMITTTAFIRGKADAASKKKGHASWKAHDHSKRQNSDKRSDFRGHSREGRESNRFTPLTRTPKEILAAEAGKFQPPSPMVTPVEKRSNNKFCDFHKDKGHSTDECMQLKKQIEELVRAGKLSHLIKEIKHGRDQSKTGKMETTAKDKPTAIYMIQSWQRMTRQKVT